MIEGVIEVIALFPAVTHELQLEAKEALPSNGATCKSNDWVVGVDNIEPLIYIKDLGKKWFGFSKMEILTPDELVERINRE